jgi:hypothetical protein
MLDNSPMVNQWALTYYAFTSLSTVGFGDFHPKSDAERFLCAFMLMGGVGIFSIIMGNFSDIIQEIEATNAPLDNQDLLSKFMSVIKHKNYSKPVKAKFKTEVEQFFAYKWSNDRNQAIDDPDELAILT